MNLLMRTIITAFLLLLISYVGIGVQVNGLFSAVIGGLVLSLLNTIVKPLLIILTLPVTILTLGLFILVINAATFGLAAWLVPGFTVSGFWPAVLAAFILSILQAILLKWK